MRGEELADDAPNDGSPGRGVEGDEEAGEDDHGGAGGRGGGRVDVVEREGTDGGEDEEIDRHADAADDEGPAAAETLHDVEAEEGHAEVDAAEDHGSHEAVVDACGFYADSGISIAFSRKKFESQSSPISTPQRQDKHRNVRTKDCRAVVEEEVCTY